MENEKIKIPYCDEVNQRVVQYMAEKFHFMYGKVAVAIFNDFCEWHLQQFHAPVHFFKEYIIDQITQQRKKSWFKNLYKREREEKQHELESRYQKIRKLVKVPTIEFFNDDNILILILQYLPLDFLLQVRNSCYFFKDFLAKYYQQILAFQKKNIYITIHSTESTPTRTYACCSDAKIYKIVCLISEVETAIVDSLVAEYISKIKVDATFKTRQVTDLLNATNQHFQQLFQAIIDEGFVSHKLGILDINKFSLNTFFNATEFEFDKCYFSNSPFQFWSIYFPDAEDEDEEAEDIIKRDTMIQKMLSQRTVTTPLYAVLYLENLINSDPTQVDQVWKHYQSLIADEHVHLVFETPSELRFLEKETNISISKLDAYAIDGRSEEEREEEIDVEHIPLQLLLAVAANIGSHNMDSKIVAVVQQYEVAIKQFFPSGKLTRYSDKI